MSEFLDYEKRGFVHSFESLGAVDGPGLRSVVFLSGCYLRCKFCHNVDMMTLKNGESMSVEEVLSRVERSRPYFEAGGGGVTFSGGEPFFQPEFLCELLKSASAAGIHTVVDSSLSCSWKEIENCLDYADMFMVSLKHFDDLSHRGLTGRSNVGILENVRRLSASGKSIWFRYVLIPGVTDTEENLRAMKIFLNEMSFERLEVLSFHKMGLSKWRELGIENDFLSAPEPELERIEAVKKYFTDAGFSVV